MTIKCPTRGDCIMDQRCLHQGRCINPRSPRELDIKVLTKFLSTLPEGHHDRPGVYRAIEVLRTEPT